MVEIFQYFSKCNLEINAQMIKTIEGKELNLFDYQVDGYYKSIDEISNHYYVVDLIWLHSFRVVKDHTIGRKTGENILEIAHACVQPSNPSSGPDQPNP